MKQSSKKKGTRFEGEIAKKLRPIFPDARRGLSQSRSGKECADIEGTPYWVECKAGKSPNVWEALEQGLEASDGRPVVIVARWDFRQTVALMRFQDFQKVLQDLADEKRANARLKDYLKQLMNEPED